MWLKLQLRYYEVKYIILYPLSLFGLWLMIIKKQWFWETEEESLKYFWDSLSFNDRF